MAEGGLWQRCLKVLLGIGMAVAFVEAATRLVLPVGNWTPEVGLGPQACALAPHNLLRSRADLNTWTTANLSPWIPLRTDHRGFRVPLEEQSSGIRREKVLVLGASNTWGMGVRAKESWPFVLAEELEGMGRPIEVLNAAQVGYTLPHMLLRARQLADSISLDRILIGVPSSGLYMFGLGSRADPWEFQNFHPWEVATLALEYPFDERPRLDEVGGFVLRRDRWGAGTIWDDVVTQSALAHRIWVKSLLRWRRLKVQPLERSIDLDLMKKRARSLGRQFVALEDELAFRGIGLHLVFFPAEWGDLVLRDDATTAAILGAFQKVARVGLRRFPRADLVADPRYRVKLDLRAGHDLLIDERHLSVSGHRKVGLMAALWYRDKVKVRNR